MNIGGRSIHFTHNENFQQYIEQNIEYYLYRYIGIV